MSACHAYIERCLQQFEKVGWRDDTQLKKIIAEARPIMDTSTCWDKKRFGSLIRYIKRLKRIAMLRRKHVGSDASSVVAFNLYTKGIGWMATFKKPVTSVACGCSHILLVSEGIPFSCGKNSWMQLGHDDFTTRDQFEMIASFSKNSLAVTGVVCGYSVSVIVTGKDAFACGCNANGRLGIGYDSSKPTKLTKIRYDALLTRIRCGSMHACALTDEGTIVSWGHHMYNGHGVPTYTPTVIDDLKDISMYNVSIDSSGYHTIATTVSGNIYTWGHNRVGQLGYRNIADSYIYPIPKRIDIGPDVAVVDACAGWGHSVLYTDTGGIYTCGRNEEGQLMLEKEKCPVNLRGHRYVDTFTKVFSDSSICRLATGNCFTGYINDNWQWVWWGNGNTLMKLENVTCVSIGTAIKCVGHTI
tara:strand:+ start:104 stop:1345 length:1242 start_codon:yes stop_codon:yes gene_type:complete